MTLQIVTLLLLLLASAIFSGSETGLYSLSRVRVDIEARQGRLMSRLVARLFENEFGLLVTILIGNNLVIQLATYVGDSISRRFDVPDAWREIVLTVFLTPPIFLFSEVLPKDLFSRRPHTLVPLVAPLIMFARMLFWPLERLLSLLTWVIERMVGLDPRQATRLRGREVVMHFLAEGRRSGALSQRAESLAGNALELRSIPIASVMVPWGRVVKLERSASEEELYESVRVARFSRLPVVGADGTCEGYVHQLDVLAGGSGSSVLQKVHPIPFLPAGMPVDRALLTLRGSGKRAAIVGDPTAPQGLLTMKDLVEEISGDLAGF